MNNTTTGGVPSASNKFSRVFDGTLNGCIMLTYNPGVWKGSLFMDNSPEQNSNKWRPNGFREKFVSTSGENAVAPGANAGTGTSSASSSSSSSSSGASSSDSKNARTSSSSSSSSSSSLKLTTSSGGSNSGSDSSPTSSDNDENQLQQQKHGEDSRGLLEYAMDAAEEPAAAIGSAFNSLMSSIGDVLMNEDEEEDLVTAASAAATESAVSPSGTGSGNTRKKRSSSSKGFRSSGSRGASADYMINTHATSCGEEGEGGGSESDNYNEYDSDRNSTDSGFVADADYRENFSNSIDALDRL